MRHYSRNLQNLLYAVFLLLNVGCVVAGVRGPSSRPLPVQEWLNNTNIETILFWPPPLNSHIIFSPSLTSGKTEVVSLSYAARDAVSTGIYTIYISEGDSFPVDFGRSRADTISRSEKIEIAGNWVDVEFLTRTSLPGRGVAIFGMDNSNVVVQWSGADEQTLLDLLAENMVHLSPDDLVIIAEIENEIALLKEFASNNGTNGIK